MKYVAPMNLLRRFDQLDIGRGIRDRPQRADDTISATTILPASSDTTHRSRRDNGGAERKRFSSRSRLSR
jgi:hypothetical protein